MDGSEGMQGCTNIGRFIGYDAYILFYFYIIKHGLTLWVHRHNTLLHVNLRFQFEFKTYTRGGSNLGNLHDGFVRTHAKPTWAM